MYLRSKQFSESLSDFQRKNHLLAVWRQISVSTFLHQIVDAVFKYYPSMNAIHTVLKIRELEWVIDPCPLRGKGLIEF